MKKDTKFKEGNPGKPKGAISEKTKFWNELKDWMTEGGADKFKEEMMSLEGKEFINAYNNALEYFKPKLSRATLSGDPENPLGNSIIINKVVTENVRDRDKDNTPTG